MDGSESYQAFLRNVNQKIEALKDAKLNFYVAIAGNNLDDKAAKAFALESAGARLMESLSAPDIPPWLPPIRNQAKLMASQKAQNVSYTTDLLRLLAESHSSLQSYRFSGGSATAGDTIDFTSLYETIYNATNADSLFNKLIEQAEQIVNSGYLDSVRATNQLQKLIAILKKNAKGDIASREFARRFAVTFLKNTFWEGMDKVPVVNVLTKAFRKTVGELDLTFEDIREKVNQQISAEATPPLPALPDLVEGELVDAKDPPQKELPSPKKQNH